MYAMCVRTIVLARSTVATKKRKQPPQKSQASHATSTAGFTKNINGPQQHDKRAPLALQNLTLAPLLESHDTLQHISNWVYMNSCMHSLMCEKLCQKVMRAWERVLEPKCVCLTREAWDLTGLHHRNSLKLEVRKWSLAKTKFSFFGHGSLSATWP